MMNTLWATTMNGMVSEWTLNNLSAYGIPVLLLVAYAGSLGIPFPITFVIMAAGALARQGILDWRLAALACLVGASMADNSEYILGHFAGQWLKRRFEHNVIWQQADSTINRQGGWAVLLTRFWLTPLAPAINIIAGTRYPYLRFLFFDLAGEILWVLLYGGLGYFFASQWERISQLVSDFNGFSVVLVILAAAIYLFVRWRKKNGRCSQRSQEPS